MKNMRRAGKSKWIFGLLLILIGIVAAWWFGLYDRTRDFSFSPASLERISSKLNESNLVKEGAQSFLNQITSLPKKIASESISKIKESIVEIAKNETGQAIDGLQASFGLNQQSISGVNERPLLVSISGGINQPINFLIEGPGEGSFYTIDWGDGEKSSGQIFANAREIIEHIWRIRGNFIILADINSQKEGVRRFSFPITIE